MCKYTLQTVAKAELRRSGTDDGWICDVGHVRVDSQEAELGLFALRLPVFFIIGVCAKQQGYCDHAQDHNNPEFLTGSELKH